MEHQISLKIETYRILKFGNWDKKLGTDPVKLLFDKSLK